jgi:hypothetical protein
MVLPVALLVFSGVAEAAEPGGSRFLLRASSATKSFSLLRGLAADFTGFQAGVKLTC